MQTGTIITIDKHTTTMNNTGRDLIDAPYYHGFQTRYEAEPLLPAQNGRFLVRLIQENDEFIYIVSVYWKGVKHHYRIYQTEHKNFFYLTTIPKRSITKLIRYHRYTETPINDESGACILKPVERTHYAIYREQITYREQNKLGEGRFAEVYRGKLRLGLFKFVDVAVKKLRENGGLSPDERIAFVREANLMMRLKHKHIVRFYGYVTYDDPILLVTEFAPGGSLLDRLKGLKGPKPNSTQRLRFSREICFGMAYLEAELVIHRDLAARNCLLDKGDHIKIADFGLALAGYKEITIRKTKAPIRYIPPETLKSGAFSNKSDMWSYGVVLFEIWTTPDYQEPYAEVQSNEDLAKGVVSGNLRLETPKGMPEQIVKLFRLTQQKNPKERPSFARVQKDFFGGGSSSIASTVWGFLRERLFG